MGLQGFSHVRLRCFVLGCRHGCRRRNTPCAGGSDVKEQAVACLGLDSQQLAQRAIHELREPHISQLRIHICMYIYIYIHIHLGSLL